MDFDDLLLYTYILLKEHPEVCGRYADIFDFVLVDEYQDTNYAQHCIVWELTQKKQQVCVVGDDAQSIYSFRGANIDNILNFTQKYNNAKLFKLEQNYRSTKTIVSAANSLISHNDRQIPKDVFSDKEKGSPLHVYSAYSDIEEAEIVVNQIAALRRKEKMEYDGFAILYRTNAQSRTFEEAFGKAMRSLENGRAGLGSDGKDSFDEEHFEELVGKPTEDRMFYIAEAFRRNWTIDQVFNASKIDRWFLSLLRTLFNM